VEKADITMDHSDCMQQLADAGIYVMLMLNGPSNQMYMANGTSTYDYDYEYLGNIDALVDHFQKYSNLFAFYFNCWQNRLEQIPFLKSLVRHTKQSMKNKKYRNIPVGVNFYGRVSKY
jgi:1,3-beta-glucanosyltransferase GAS5